MTTGNTRPPHPATEASDLATQPAQRTQPATTSRFDWTGAPTLLGLSVAAVALTAWQVHVDRSVFEPYFGALDPIPVMTGAAIVGVVALAYLQARSGFAVHGPGSWQHAISTIVWAVPLLTAVAIVADLAFRFPEDTNVALPDALRFYPVIAVFVEFLLHALSTALLVSFLGTPHRLDRTFWRIAIPVAAIEAILQAAYATSLSTSVFSATHLMIFGVAQIWMFWRFGFTWMLGFRLAYYALWHLAWGVARLAVLF